MSKSSEFVPQIFEEPTHWSASGGGGYATMLVQFDRCPTCSKPMLAIGRGGPFSRGHDVTAKAQIARAGWSLISASTTGKHNKHICTKCEAAGKASFICALCGETRSGKPQESFGGPAEHLCVRCYETVPAKQWEEKSEELRERHRWDFE